MTDSQNLTAEIDFGFDSIPFWKSGVERDYSMHEQIEVRFESGTKYQVCLGALPHLAKPESFKAVLRNGYLIMIYKPWLYHKEKTWDNYFTAIEELKASGIEFKLSSVLYPWLTFRAECLRQFIDKKLTYAQIREALK